MTVKEFYESIHADYQGAIKTMMMDDFIKRMLGKFILDNRVDDLSNGYKNKDYKTVFEAAHSIKGVTGNLSLTNLYELIAPIVEATRHVNEGEVVNIDKEIEPFINEYQFVVSQIKILLED